VDFVLAIVLDEFHTAQLAAVICSRMRRTSGDATLREKVEHWLSGHDPEAFQMGRSERPTLFACYRAAGMMKALFVLCSDAIRFVLTGVSQLDVT
jgi:hypothetical protein